MQKTVGIEITKIAPSKLILTPKNFASIIKINMPKV